MAKTDETKKPREKERLAKKLGVGEGGGFDDVERVDKKDIDGVEVILVDFKFGKSQFKEADATHPQGYEFAMILIEVDGEQKQCFIGGQVVVEALKKVDRDKDLPAPVIFLKEKTKDGKRTFWTMK